MNTRQKECSNDFCPPGGERILKGFEVSQNISVKVRDTEKAGKVIAGIGELGASDISGLNLQLMMKRNLLKRRERKRLITRERKRNNLQRI